MIINARTTGQRYVKGADKLMLCSMLQTS